MVKTKKHTLTIPLSIPKNKVALYKKNYETCTHKTGRLFLFAADQKIEHLNDDFHGPNIPEECNDPRHLFEIAKNGRIGAFATQLGLITRYGMDYKKVPYIIKLNSKTNLVPSSQTEPVSLLIDSLDDVVSFVKTSPLHIAGLGYTIYLGSEHEAAMLTQARSVVTAAHKHGLLAIIWIYPRGKAIKKDDTPSLIAGAAGVGACLGADFVKIKPPQGKTSQESARALKQAVGAAGRSGVICSGGAKKDVKRFLTQLHDQISIAGARGNATGRNIFQNTFDDAVALTQAIAAITFDGASVTQAIRFLK